LKRRIPKRRNESLDDDHGEDVEVNLSEPFIRRPIGTILLSLGLFLVGILGYEMLPVASLPTVDLPTISVTSSRPGADPAVMAATVAAPIERRLGEIAGLTELTSTSSLGTSNIIAQFDLNRNVDGAARDVQAALNAAVTDLPSDLPVLPIFHKWNPASIPILILGLTSDTISSSAIYDQADTVIAQRLSQVDGVAQVMVTGADQPAMRIRVNNAELSAMGLSLDDIRLTIANANTLNPNGLADGVSQAQSIGTNSQLKTPEDYRRLVVRNRDGNSVLLGSVANVELGVRNVQSAAWANGKPAVLLIITKQVDANVNEVVDHLMALLPELQRFITAGIDISVISDRTKTIRASVADMQKTLLITIVMVMCVVFVFLRRLTATLAAGVTIPLALSGTFALMWVAHFSIDNISLMALAVAVGFIVDDAIVMIENIDTNLQKGMPPFQAAVLGSKQIGFTIISISVSMVAAFIPLLLMDGLAGRFFREFSVTLVFTIGISTLVSLTLTPMICAHLMRPHTTQKQNLFDLFVERILDGLRDAYAASLKVVLRHRALTMLALVLTIVATFVLFAKTPKSVFPQDDTGLLSATTEAATDISYKAMSRLQQQVGSIISEDPAVASYSSSIGGSGQPGVSGGLNQGKLYISLKPPGERGNLNAAKIIDRLRLKLANVPGMSVYLIQEQDLRVGGRPGKGQYQFTLWDQDLGELLQNVPKIVDRLKLLPGLADVSTDREANGLQANVVIDRLTAARLGVSIQSIDDALNNAFSQRQISIVYSSRNQYRVVIEVDPNDSKDPADLSKIYVPGAGGSQIPLSTLSHIEKGFAPLVTNHQGQFPSVTITYNLTGNATLGIANAAIADAIAVMHLPDALHADFAGDAKLAVASAGSQVVLLIVALLAVYIVLGVLYESLAHPLTIISTLPSAGLGALLALQWSNTELSLIAFIGIILLIGIVKKNGIMLVDFALDGERARGLNPEQAIYEACLERFRPILMTSLAAFFGAIPLIIATGPGSELRRPLGITIAGGLIVSQILTLYTTPVIYLLLDRLHLRLSRIKTPTPQQQPIIGPQL
jgi:multidrug efflux pump